MTVHGLTRHWKWGAVLAAVGLVGLVVPLGSARAREIYCASDEEAADLHGGVLGVILGPQTQLVQDSIAPGRGSNIVWTGQAQQCPATAKDACQGRVDHSTTVSYTRMMNIAIAGDLTGTGTVAHWTPILAAAYGYAKTNTTAFDIALLMNIDPGQTWQPVVKVSETIADGHYVGAYRHVGEAAGCHQYALDPNLTFGQYRATLQDNPVSTWVQQ